MIHLYEYYSAIKEEILPLWLHGWNLRSLYQVKQVRQKKTNTIWPLLHVESEETGLIETENRLLVASAEVGVGREGAGGQRVQTFIYNTSKFWGSNMQHDDYNWQYTWKLVRE